MSHWPKYKFMNFRKILSPKTTDKMSDRFHNLVSKYIEPYEPVGPRTMTSFPGPKTLEYNQQMIQLFGDTHEKKEVIDIKNSFGNYFLDLDGNVVLDMYMDNGRNLLGYNHRNWYKDTMFQRYAKYMIQRPAMGQLPPEEYPKMLLNILSKFAPSNVPEVYLSCGCGSSANENAIKFAFLKKYYDIKGNNNISKEEEESALNGRLPGTPKFSVIGFEGGHHGKFLSQLSLKTDKERIKRNCSLFPKFNWPIASFPKIKYPYEENYDHNRREETRCVEETEKLIRERKGTEQEVAALIIEPLQLHSGVNYASSKFYGDLLNLCYDHNVAFICDETDTSGWVNGRPFLHSSWNLEKPVHMVTFSGRMQASGLYYQPEFRPRLGGQIHSTWNGDPVKILLLEDTSRFVKKFWLDTHAAQFMQSVKAELFDLQRKWSVRIYNIRGIGKIFAFDVEHKHLRDEIVNRSRDSGFKVSPLGDLTIAFTPSLMFTEIHLARYKEFLLKLEPSTHYMFSPQI
jgi:4-aminobutyrate aminotransferase/(S)-3-amino-2-methylpropionate transaminase